MKIEMELELDELSVTPREEENNVGHDKVEGTGDNKTTKVVGGWPQGCFRGQNNS